MFEKMKLKREIGNCQKQIAAIEKKRIRSQAALVNAILQHQTPDDKDVDFFNQYSAEIDEVRDKMHKMQKVLENM